MDLNSTEGTQIIEKISNSPNQDRSLNPNVSVECVVFGFDENKLKVLLIEQFQPHEIEKPEKNKRFALPGDLIFDDESLHKAAARILKDLTKLDNIYLKQFHAFGKPQRLQHDDDITWLQTIRSNASSRVISVAYFALVNISDYQPGIGSFAKNSVWMDINKLPQLVFDHNHILGKALLGLRSEIFNHRVALNLLPEKFTLRQFQKVYEAILGKELDKRNFRKMVKKMDHIKPLDEKESGVQHKRAQLFKFLTEK